MLHNKTKPVKQIFMQEVKEKLKHVGDYAFLVDRNDYIIKLDPHTYTYLKDLNTGIETLDLIKEQYNIMIHDMLGDIVLQHDYNYSDTSNRGYTTVNNNTLVQFMKVVHRNTVVLPHTIKYIIDTTEHSPMFNNDIEITHITLNQHLKSVGANTFRNLINLEHITFNKGLQHIHLKAFENCIALDTLELPQSLETVGMKAFNNTNIDTITLYNVNDIGAQAFHTNKSTFDVILYMNPDHTNFYHDSFTTINGLQGVSIYVLEQHLEQYKQKYPQLINNFKPLEAQAL